MCRGFHSRRGANFSHHKSTSSTGNLFKDTINYMGWEAGPPFPLGKWLFRAEWSGEAQIITDPVYLNREKWVIFSLVCVAWNITFKTMIAQRNYTNRPCSCTSKEFSIQFTGIIFIQLWKRFRNYLHRLQAKIPSLQLLAMLSACPQNETFSYPT